MRSIYRFLNRANNGKYLYTPGYHKFLLDFKLFDRNGRILPQEAVVPIFNNEFNKRILEDYVKGMKEELPNDEVYDAVKEAIGLGEKQLDDKEVKNLIIETGGNITNKKQAIQNIPEGGLVKLNKDTQKNIKVSRRTLRHSALHDSSEIYEAFQRIEDIIENAVKIGQIPVAQDEIGKTNSVSVFYMPINIDGTQYSARLVVKELINNELVLDTLSLYNISMHKEKTPSNTNGGELNNSLVYSDSVKSFYKVKDLIHNTQEIDKGILGISGETSFRVVEDQNLIDKLESEPKIKVYRAMQLIDGKLYPPMSAKVDGKLREPIELGKWEMAEERPELADERGYFKLDKGNSKSLKARYNPYIHTSTTPLNDQFSSAQSRPELVTVEVEIPESELTSGYKAEKAKDAVGKVEWKAGAVQSKLSGTRTVILSRYDKPIRIVPDSEVADEIVKMLDGKDITMPSNVVTPSLRAELEKRGVPFVETDNQGKKVDGTRFRTLKYSKLRKLEEGETCNIERAFTTLGMFNFSN